MKYIRNVLFHQHDGKSFTIADDDRGVPEHHASTSEVLALALRVYDENHNRFVRDGKLLSPSEIGAFNRLLPALEVVAHDGVIVLETGDYTLLVKLVAWVFPTSPAWRDTQEVLAVLQGAANAPSETPENKSALNGHAAHVLGIEMRVGLP